MRGSVGGLRAWLLLGLLAVPAVAPAQTALPKNPPLPPSPPPAVQQPPGATQPSGSPYEAQLDRLAELLGTLAFMRDLCKDGDAAAWRDKMAALLEAEAGVAARRERLAGNYNRGYEAYRLTYRACTASAQTIIARSLEEGSRLAKDLAVRFGGE